MLPSDFIFYCKLACDVKYLSVNKRKTNTYSRYLTQSTSLKQNITRKPCIPIDKLHLFRRMFMFYLIKKFLCPVLTFMIWTIIMKQCTFFLFSEYFCITKITVFQRC